jgi:hypothetical protein
MRPRRTRSRTAPCRSRRPTSMRIAHRWRGVGSARTVRGHRPMRRSSRQGDRAVTFAGCQAVGRRRSLGASWARAARRSSGRSSDVPRSRPQPVATPTTDEQGRFSFVLPKGPSRRVSVEYRASFGDRHAAARWRFKVAVPAPIKLLPSRVRLKNNETLLLTARLSDAEVPRGSSDVAFQVKIGRQWRTFARRRLDEHGRAQIRHTFRVTFHRMTYRFRAVTLRRASFPYADSRSPVVAVRVN